MNKMPVLYLSTYLLTLAFTSFTHANGLIQKEVYSFKDKNGSVVFTDRAPTKEKTYTTQTIKAANSRAKSKTTYQPKYNNQTGYSNSAKEQVVRVIVEDGLAYEKKLYEKKRTLALCKSFKQKLDYYSDKMNAGYKNSEYKNLEKNRKKYRNLLFDNC